MKRKLIVTGLLFQTLAAAYGYMNVDPVIFDKKIDTGATQEYHVTNTTNVAVGYRVYTEKASEEKDMTSWIEYYPRELKLEPGETGKVKVYIEAPAGTEKGEYTSILGIKEVSIPDSEKGNASVAIYTNLKMEIAGYVGDLTPKVDIIELKKSGDSLYLKIKNTGEIRTKVEAFLSSSNLKEPIYIDSFRLLQGKEKESRKTLKLKAGKNNNNLKLLILDTNGNKILEKKIEG